MSRAGHRGAAVCVVALATLAVAVGVATAGHSVRFVQSEVAADSEVTLELRVPEAGEGHKPEGTQDHHTTQMKVSVPAAFEALGCVPPDGWDCARTGELFRFFQEDELLLNRPDSLVLGLYLRAPDENGSWGIRTVQVYNDGHETRFTVEGGTAPTVAVTGAEPPPSPSPSPSPSPQVASPEPSATPAANPTPSPSPEPSPAAADPSPTSTRSSPTPTVSTSPTAAPTPSPTPTTTAPTSDDATGDDDTAGDATAGDATAGDATADATTADEAAETSGGLDGLARAALSLLVVAGGWSIVEFRARRRRDT